MTFVIIKRLTCNQ